MIHNVRKQVLIAAYAIMLAFPQLSYAVSVKSYSYDKYGNVQEIKDPRGFATQYHYDLLNRLEEIDYPEGKKVIYSYDLSGVRVKMKDHRGTTLFEPDEFGQINKVTFPDGKTVSYRYDPEGNLIKLIYPDKTEIEYSYDLSNRLESVKDSTPTLSSFKNIFRDLYLREKIRAGNRIDWKTLVHEFFTFSNYVRPKVYLEE